MRGQVSDRQSQAVAEHDGDEGMGRSEEDPGQIRRLLVRLWIHQNQQQPADTDINCEQGNYPRAFPFLHLEEKQQRYQGDEQADPIIFVNDVPDEHPDLQQKMHRTAKDI